MADRNVTIEWIPQGETIVRVDRAGVGHLNVPVGATELTMLGGPKKGKEPGRIAYIECRKGAPFPISVGQVLERGYTPTNDCKQQTQVAAKPGELIFYALPLPWWKPDFQ